MARGKKANTDQAAQAAAGNGSVQGTRTGNKQGADNETNVLLKKLMEAVQGLQAQQAQQAAASSSGFSQDQWEALNRAAERGMDEDDLRRMMSKFAFLNSARDPESELYRSLTNGTMAEYLKGVEQKSAAAKQAEEQKRKDAINQALKAYKMHPGLMAANIAGQAIGNVASAAGDISNAYRSNLASAIMTAASQGSPGTSSEQKAKFGDLWANPTPAQIGKAAGHQYVGQKNKIIGDTINRVIQGVLGNINAESQIQRQFRTQMELHPSQEFYRTNYNWVRDANKITNDLR